MKYFLSILTLSFLLAGELEVEGDLKVTGNIQAGVIDSLQQVIAGLQAQVAALQASGNVSSRIVELSLEMTGEHDILIYSLNELLSESQDWYRISFISIDFGGTEESMTCNYSFGAGPHGFNLSDPINDVSIPMYPLSINRNIYGELEVESDSYSGPVYMISDDDPKLAIKVNTPCAIHDGGYWMGIVTFKFLAESNFSNEPTIRVSPPPQNSRSAQ